MMDLQDLRERVAGATGADRELDAQLAVSVHPEWREKYEPTDRYGDGGFVQSRGRPHEIRSSPAYTASVDAALALIDQVAPDWYLERLRQVRLGDRQRWFVTLQCWRDQIHRNAPTPALALISALLAAVEAGQPVSEAEEWRDVPDCPGYQASSHGRIRSRRGVVRGALDQYGYRWSPVGHWKARRCVKHHTMVAAAFLGPKPDGADVDHLDGDKTNNRPDNLEYVAHADNMRRMMTRLGRTRLTEEQVREILASQGISYSVLAERYNISKQTIEGIKNGRIWKHVRTTGGTTSV